MEELPLFDQLVDPSDQPDAPNTDDQPRRVPARVPGMLCPGAETSMIGKVDFQVNDFEVDTEIKL